MNILFLASEVVPFAKTGGLADVAGALPKALHAMGHDVRVILPRYRAVDVKTFGFRARPERISVTLGGQALEGTVYESVIPHTAIPVYAINQPALFDRDGLYQDKGKDFPDNLQRFSFFSQAGLRAIQQLGWKPDVLHAHDWQAALACAHLALTQEPFWQSTGTVFTVHNLAYQGLFPKEQWSVTSLPERAFSVEGLEFYGQINCLKGGLVLADMLTTVSPTYAKEIQTPAFGCGLDGVLVRRQGDLVGIINGIDPDEWNPQTDPHLTARYGTDEAAGKSLCKLTLQTQQRLPSRHVLLIGMIQRLAEQKGLDIFSHAADELLALPIQLIILGTGEPVYHEKLRALAKRFPEQVAVNLTFDNALAHQIEAGCDAFLMPSRFEPCGLNQLYSMRYGAVPIVHRVGGLADTVTDVSPTTLEDGTATGVVFDDYSSRALVDAVKRAVAAFGDHALWGRLVRHGMMRDFSWEASARDYLRVYARALAKHRTPASAATPS